MNSFICELSCVCGACVVSVSCVVVFVSFDVGSGNFTDGGGRGGFAAFCCESVFCSASVSAFAVFFHSALACSLPCVRYSRRGETVLRCIAGVSCERNSKSTPAKKGCERTPTLQKLC